MQHTALSDALTPGLAAALSDVGWEPLLGPEELLRKAAVMVADGARLRSIGTSREGQGLWALEIGSGPKTLLGWGYPHPDEPLGAAALLWLAQAKLAGRLPDLDAWRLILVLCADPDQASRQLWLPAGRRPASAREFVAGSWAPTGLGLEVEYGFPIDHFPLYQPLDYLGRCHAACDHLGCQDAPYGPLPESAALAALIEAERPDLVCAMHNEHSGGCYTFILHRESEATERDLKLLPDLCGSVRQLGEQLDPGQRAGTDPDLLMEMSLAERLERLQSMPGYEAGASYNGNVSAASFVEALDPRMQFFCPETSLFRIPAFDDRGPDPRGRSRRQLALAALKTRREALAAGERIWTDVLGLDGLASHPGRDEFAAGYGSFDLPAAETFSDPSYERTATVAEAASFEYFWPLHTAHLLGSLGCFLDAQDPERPEIARAIRDLHRLQRQILMPVPEELLLEADRPAALRSQLARLFRLMLSR